MHKAFHYKSITSTNDVAKQRVLDGETMPFFVIADGQTNGRGRRGNDWNSSNNGNLYTSYVCSINHAKISNIALLPQCVAIKICEAISQNLNIIANVKWPNDIFINDKKVGGILLETIINHDENITCIIGVGMNIYHAPDLKNSKYDAICLSDIAQQQLNDDIKNIISHAIVSGCDMFECSNVTDIEQQWHSFDMFHDQVIEVTNNNTTIFGNNLGINDTGALQLMMLDGDIVCVNEADARIKIL